MKLPETKLLVAAAVGAAAALALAALWGARPGRSSETIVYSLAAPAAPTPSLPTAKRADILFESGRFAEALPVYRQAVAENPKDADSWMDLGLTLAQLGQGPEETVTALTTATRLEPDNQRAWLSFGFVLKRAGRSDEARAALSKAVSLGPKTEMAQEAQAMLSRL